MPIGIITCFLPWLLYFAILETIPEYSDYAGLIGLCCTAVCSLPFLQKKFMLTWFSLFYFSAVFIFDFLQYDKYNIVELSSVFPLVIALWASIIYHRPYTLPYWQAITDPITQLTPPFKHINYAVSICWALTLSIISLLSLPSPTPSHISAIIEILLVIFAVAFSAWFPDWYHGFLFRRFSKPLVDVDHHPFLTGNYAPVKQEISADQLPIVGKIPAYLRGCYIRNGPNPAFTPISYAYPIDGDGMLHGIYLTADGAAYKNRYVLTKGLQAEQKAQKALYGGVEKPIPTDPKLIGKNGDPGPIKNGAFIHIIRHAKQYLAMYEGGSAYEVTKNLATLGEWTPPENSSPLPMNAHTRLDPKTGNLHAFIYQLISPYLTYYVFDNQFKLIHKMDIDKEYPSMIHDFVITENHTLFFDTPVIFDLRAMIHGGEILKWRPEKKVQIAIINRDHQIIWIPTESFHVYHFANAYENGDQLIVDYVRHEQFSLNPDISGKTPPYLYRATIDLKSQVVTHTKLLDKAIEFPRINDTLTGRPYRYLYALQPDHAILKYDLTANKAEYHDFGPDIEVGEAVFAADPQGTQEDDGVLMLFCYHKSTNTSQFIVLDAKNIECKPIASMTLPQRVPHGLHGSWFFEEE